MINDMTSYQFIWKFISNTLSSALVLIGFAHIYYNHWLKDIKTNAERP